MDERNAIIESATLTTDDHGCLSGWINLDYGGSGQGFGGYALYLPQSFSHHDMMSVAGHWIWRVMEVAGVVRWADLPGKTVRVKASFDKVDGIGHITKDDWFFPSVDFREAEKEDTC